MSKRITVKDLKAEVDEGFTRINCKVDAMMKQGGLAKAEPSDLVKDISSMKTNIEKIETILSEVFERIETLERPWWKFEWIKKRMNK